MCVLDSEQLGRSQAGYCVFVAVHALFPQCFDTSLAGLANDIWPSRAIPPTRWFGPRTRLVLAPQRTTLALGKQRSLRIGSKR